MRMTRSIQSGGLVASLFVQVVAKRRVSQQLTVDISNRPVSGQAIKSVEPTLMNCDAIKHNVIINWNKVKILKASAEAIYVRLAVQISLQNIHKSD